MDHYETKKIEGIITDIKKSENKTIFELKSTKKYLIATYDEFKFNLGNKVLIDARIYISNENTSLHLPL